MSVLSLVTPAQEGENILVAVGKGSGSFEVWECDMESGKLDKAGCYDAHDYVVSILTILILCSIPLIIQVFKNLSGYRFSLGFQWTLFVQLWSGIKFCEV